MHRYLNGSPLEARPATRYRRGAVRWRACGPCCRKRWCSARLRGTTVAGRCRPRAGPGAPGPEGTRPARGLRHLPPASIDAVGRGREAPRPRRELRAWRSSVVLPVLSPWGLRSAVRVSASSRSSPGRRWIASPGGRCAQRRSRAELLPCPPGGANRFGTLAESDRMLAVDRGREAESPGQAGSGIRPLRRWERSGASAHVER